MSDLTFSALQAALPANSITASGGDVTISVRNVMGEASAALTDQKLGELLSKLLDAAAAAQTNWNATNTPRFRSYNPPTAGTPFRDQSTGQFRATFTYTTAVDIPLDRNQVLAVQTQQTVF